MDTKEVVILDACRTAVGNMGGSLKPLSSKALSSAPASTLLK